MIKRVMLIDDSESDLLFGRLMLERSGVVGEVLTAESGAEALQRLTGPEGLGVDLVLLDINMPGMDGFSFLEHWCPDHLHGPAVVMLTSSPDPADRARAAGFPCVRGYLTKPLARSAVAELDARLAGRSPPAGA